MVSIFSKPRAGVDQDVHIVVVLGNITILVVIDGHGGEVSSPLGKAILSDYFQIFSNPLKDAVEKSLKGLLAQVWMQTHPNLKEVAEEVKGGLLHTIVEALDAAYRNRSNADPRFVRNHCGATFSAVLSRGGEHVAIWIGDSPVYSLESGKLVTHPNGAPENPEEVFPRKDPRIYFRAFSSEGKVANITGEKGPIGVQHSGIGLELLLLKEGVDAERYIEVLNDLWRLYPWRVSEVFTGPFIVASDGIDHLLPREKVSDEVRLPLLRAIATNPAKALRDKYQDRSPSDDTTILVVGVEQEPS